tara:strand:+ start:1969 stop:2709 length:741 start_codon:yes stop_codon:yes gene_type:complete
MREVLTTNISSTRLFQANKILTLFFLCIILSSTTISAKSTQTNTESKSIKIGFSTGVWVLDKYKKLIQLAYQDLNYKVTFIELPLARLGDNGFVDAMLIHPSIVENHLTDFTRVPVKLDEGKIVLYCHNEYDCDEEQLNNEKNVIGIFNGDNFASSIMKNRCAQVYKIMHIDQGNQLFLMRRINFILTIDRTDLDNQVTMSTKKYSKYEVLPFDAYHYIHKSKQHLIPALVDSLNAQLKNNPMIND